MKKFFVAVMLMSIMMECQESKDNTMQKLPRQYDKAVGEQIPVEVAYRWIKNFNRITMAGRTSHAYSINAGTLADVIGNVDDRLGVVVHHGIDDSDNHHLMIFAIDEDGVLFKNKIVDVSKGNIIDESTARAWSDKYALQHSATPWYHFIGSDIFSEIQSNQAFDYVDIVRGLNENNEEQILLFVYNTRGNSGGRSEAEVLVFDKTNPCPPCSI